MLVLPILVIVFAVDLFLVVIWPPWHRKSCRHDTWVRRLVFVGLAGLEGGFWLLVSRYPGSFMHGGLQWLLYAVWLAAFGLLALSAALYPFVSWLQDNPRFQHLREVSRWTILGSLPALFKSTDPEIEAVK